MKYLSLVLFLSVVCASLAAQPKHSFSLEMGGISTHNTQAQPATSISGNFTRDLVQVNENMLISLSVDFSTYIADGFKLSHCSDCISSEYSGWDAGLKINFVPTQANIPVHVFTGLTRVITKETVTIGILPNGARPITTNSRNYINTFWDLGISFDFPITQKFFFATEAIAGYSLETEPGAQQGFERIELNAGIGVRF